MRESLFSADDLIRIANKSSVELAGEFRLGQESVHISTSAGIAFYPNHGEDMDGLIMKRGPSNVRRQEQ